MKKILCAKIVFLFYCGVLSAESSMSDEPLQKLNLKQGTLIEIEKVDGTIIEGKWGVAGPDRIAIRVGQAERFVGTKQIARIYRLERKSRRGGAIRGVKMGALAGAGVALMFIIAYRNEDVSPLLPIFYFMPMGVGIGAAIGSQIPGHNRVPVFERKYTGAIPKNFSGPISGSFVIRF